MKRIAIPIETTKLCHYGCGNIARFENGSKNLMCSERHNSCPANKIKNGLGIKRNNKETNRNHKEQYKNLPLDKKNSMAWNRGKGLLSSLEYKCECGITDTWQGKKITLELDHINGINSDNRIENLRYLCPNCHSQTPTFRGRNINKGVQKVSDEELLTCYKKNKNIRQTLLELGLAAKGGNYLRVQKLLQKNIDSII